MILEDVQVTVLTHGDCRNFVSVDVAKGFCRRTNEMVAINAPSCDAYERLPKCKFCSKYAGTAEGMGTCQGDASGSWAYPEMIAVTCEMYQGK